jgi:hypothetical protein
LKQEDVAVEDAESRDEIESERIEPQDFQSQDVERGDAETNRQRAVQLVQATMAAMEEFYMASIVHIRLTKRYDFARDLLEQLEAKARTEAVNYNWLREQMAKIWEYATIEAIEGTKKES